MKNTFLFISLLLSNIHTFGQVNTAANKFKVFNSTQKQISDYYKNTLSNVELKTGEKVASVGAGNGSQEVQLAIYNPAIEWTLQEIDTTSLNPKAFEKVKKNYENIIGKPIDGQFSFVIGAEKKANLPLDYFDKVLLFNVFHELDYKRMILADIHNSLKKNGRVIIMENIARTIGQKDPGCHRIKIWEPDFIREMEGYNFKLISKKEHLKIRRLFFYVFEKL
jgi:SAM-dependent methyltransferase